MLKVDKIDTQSRAQVRRFIQIQFDLYANHPQWVPPLFMDAEMQLNREKHPYYEHSDADFFIAVRDGRDVGRIAALENRHFNEYHGTREAEFYLFDCIDDLEVAGALFERVFEWARARGLKYVVGPKGFSSFDGYGLQVEGFEHRQMMTHDELQLRLLPAPGGGLGLHQGSGFRLLLPECRGLPLAGTHSPYCRARAAQGNAHRAALQEQEGAHRLGGTHRPGLQSRPSLRTGSTTRSPSAR